MRRVRLKTVKRQRSHTKSIHSRIRKLNALRAAHRISLTEDQSRSLRSSSRRGNFNQHIPERICRRIETGLEVQIFPKKGRGVVSTQFFAKGEAILEYIGELIERKEGLRRELEVTSDSGSYLFFFNHKGRDLCIDATSEDNPTLGRLVNHSRLHANTKMKKFEGENGSVHLILCALRDIEPFEEILYDYGERRADIISCLEWIRNT